MSPLVLLRDGEQMRPHDGTDLCAAHDVVVLGVVLVGADFRFARKTGELSGNEKRVRGYLLRAYKDAVKIKQAHSQCRQHRLCVHHSRNVTDE